MLDISNKIRFSLNIIIYHNIVVGGLFRLFCYYVEGHPFTHLSGETANTTKHFEIQI